jgi:hypothetical protein
LANSAANVQLARRSAARSKEPMSLLPLRTLFFEDLSVGMTDFGIFAGWRTNQRKLVSA